ncbi:DUF3299 domain-containing protein [Rhodoflexus caldus]|uniref:DUF3299 domain-containing protein n=1 Tax=Rhodoflexus caldus TaxID=2891236 RepID=UPI00202A6350|nr:DUF3299 domain-containing protein [Rhodoflexus caldus]
MRYTKYLLLLLIVFFAIRLWWQRTVEQRETERLNATTGFEQYQPQTVSSYKYIVKESDTLKKLGDPGDTLWHKEKSAALWNLLRNVAYEKNNVFYEARFSDELQALEGKEVSLKGFVIPLESSENTHFVLSYFPYASCFFCGGSGPESVVEVHAQKPIAFTDKPVVIRGILRLNNDDPEQLFFALEDAVVEKAAN